jgi:hypothetical protein
VRCRPNHSRSSSAFSHLTICAQAEAEIEGDIHFVFWGSHNWGAFDVYEGKTKEHPIRKLSEFKSSKTGTIGSREGIGDAI